MGWFVLLAVCVFVSVLEHELLCGDMFTFLRLCRSVLYIPLAFSRFLCMCGWVAVSHIHILPTPAVMIVTDRTSQREKGRKPVRSEDKQRLSGPWLPLLVFRHRVKDSFMYV